MIIGDRQKLIRSVFTAVVKEAARKEEQRDFLLSHQNYPFWVTAMEKQIRIAELNPRFKLTPVRLNELIKAGAQIACQCWINAKIKELMTPAELRRMEAKASELKDTQAMLDDMAAEAMKMANSTTKGMYSGGKPNALKASEAAKPGQPDQSGLGSGSGPASIIRSD